MKLRGPLVFALATMLSSAPSASCGSTPAPAPINVVYVAIQRQGAVAALAIDEATGALTPVSGSPFATGRGPAGIAANARFLFTANADTADVSVFSIDLGTGALSALGSIGLDTPPFTEMRTLLDPTGKFLYVSSFSGAISAFNVADGGDLRPMDGSPFTATGAQVGGHPFDMAMDPRGAHLYLLAQGTSPNKTGVLEYDIDPASGALTKRSELPLANLLSPHLAIDPTGAALFYTDTLKNEIGSIALDASGGMSAGANSANDMGASEPLDMVADASGSFLFATNFQTGAISAFAIGADASLSATVAGAPFAASSKPQAIAFDPSSKFLYAVDSESAVISAYAVDAHAGALTPVAGAPFAIERDATASFLVMTTALVK